MISLPSNKMISDFCTMWNKPANTRHIISVHILSSFYFQHHPFTHLSLEMLFTAKLFLLGITFCRVPPFDEASLKGPEWNPLLFAHPPTLNHRKPIGCADPSLGVCDGGTPYVAISKGFRFGIQSAVPPQWCPKPFDIVPPSQTLKVGSVQPMGFRLFKVERWANSNGFHSGPLRSSSIFRKDFESPTLP